MVRGGQKPTSRVSRLIPYVIGGVAACLYTSMSEDALRVFRTAHASTSNENMDGFAYELQAMFRQGKFDLCSDSSSYRSGSYSAISLSTDQTGFNPSILQKWLASDLARMP